MTSTPANPDTRDAAGLDRPRDRVLRFFANQTRFLLFGRPDPLMDGLPKRVADAIKAQELRNEILIAWVQLGLVLFFGVLYAVAPKADGSLMGDLEPVPMAIAGYMLFTVARLGLAYAGFMPNFLVSFSIFLDMTLLMGLIWSFHLQYQQPAAFYLKAPTMLYIFIFIALRALRFDPRFVLFAGGLGVLGWSTLVLYAVVTSQDSVPITRLYSEYILGTGILIGAEFDKIVAVLIVTLVLSLAVVRGRHLLLTAVREGQAALLLKRFFAADVADTITASEVEIAPGDGEVRDAAILFVDLRGFTTYADGLEPRAVIGALASYQDRVVAAVRDQGGVIDKFLGDGVLASFGAARPMPDYAARALAAADAVIRAGIDWNAERRQAGEARELRVNAAVAAGSVVFGVVGGQGRLEVTTIGAPVNLAAKLETHNKTAGTAALTDRTTYDLAIGQGYAPAGTPRPLPASTVAGVIGPIDLVALA